MIKDFKFGDKFYSKIQSVNGGWQWECRYPDCETARLMIYKARPTRADVINAFIEQECNISSCN